MRWLALLAILLIVPSALAASVTVDIFGTNASNAQSNITKTGNNSYNVSIWNTGDNTKTVLASINGNASDSITFTLHNFTASRVVEVKVNSSSFNSYQADSTGTISFTRVQTIQNQTYSFTPSIHRGGYNFTWAQFWTWPSLFGVNLTQYFLPYSGATADLNMNNYNITNVSDIQSTTTNITVLNATSMIGNGSGITRFNASNATNVLPNASAPISSLNRSATNVFSANTSNISVVKQANDSYAIDLVASSASLFTNVTQPAKDVNILYQNTDATKPRMVVITANVPLNEAAQVNIGSANPPAIVLMKLDATVYAAMNPPFSFIVPPLFYYSFNETSGTGTTVVYWREIQ